MSHFSTALTDIVDRSFGGKWAELSRKCGLDGSVISRLAAGKFEPTIERLDEICAAMSRSDRKQLLIAAARDRVPARFQEEIFGDEDPASQILRAKLAPDLAAVIRYLESNAMSDELTAAYLRKIGQWIFGEAPAAAGSHSGAQFEVVDKVAEEPVKYRTKREGK